MFVNQITIDLWGLQRRTTITKAPYFFTFHTALVADMGSKEEWSPSEVLSLLSSSIPHLGAVTTLYPKQRLYDPNCVFWIWTTNNFGGQKFVTWTRIYKSIQQSGMCVFWELSFTALESSVPCPYKGTGPDENILQTAAATFGPANWSSPAELSINILVWRYVHPNPCRVDTYYATVVG